MGIDEQSQKLGELLARLRDGIQGLLPAVEAIDAYLTYLGQKMEEKWSWDPGKVKWTQENGFKGPYEKAVPEGQPTHDFKIMLADLKQHKDKLSRNGSFYWIFEDGVTVGRKKRSSQ